MTHDPGSPLAPITPSMEGLGPGPPDATRTSARSPPRQTFTRGQWDLVISFCPPPEAVLTGCLSSLMLQASLCRGGYSRFTPY